MNRVPASQAREKFADILNEVAFQGERIRVQRSGKDIVAVVPIEDLELIEALEDRADLAAMKKALAEKGERVPWSKLKAELGLR
jgi:prevent-host-death family protein